MSNTITTVENPDVDGARAGILRLAQNLADSIDYSFVSEESAHLIDDFESRFIVRFLHPLEDGFHRSPPVINDDYIMTFTSTLLPRITDLRFHSELRLGSHDLKDLIVELNDMWTGYDNRITLRKWANVASGVLPNLIKKNRLVKQKASALASQLSINEKLSLKGDPIYDRPEMEGSEVVVRVHKSGINLSEHSLDVLQRRAAYVSSSRLKKALATSTRGILGAETKRMFVVVQEASSILGEELTHSVLMTFDVTIDDLTIRCHGAIPMAPGQYGLTFHPAVTGRKTINAYVEVHEIKIVTVMVHYNSVFSFTPRLTTTFGVDDFLGVRTLLSDNESMIHPHEFSTLRLGGVPESILDTMTQGVSDLASLCWRILYVIMSRYMKIFKVTVSLSRFRSALSDEALGWPFLPVNQHVMIPKSGMTYVEFLRKLDLHIIRIVTSLVGICFLNNTVVTPLPITHSVRHILGPFGDKTKANLIWPSHPLIFKAFKHVPQVRNIIDDQFRRFVGGKTHHDRNPQVIRRGTLDVCLSGLISLDSGYIVYENLVLLKFNGKYFCAKVRNSTFFNIASDPSTYSMHLAERVLDWSVL